MIRESVIAGSWYSDGKEELSKEIDSYLENAGIAIKEKPISLISPHAGYIYSGQVAAYCYKQVLNKEYNRVIIIAPSHRYSLRGAALFDSGAFNTPLGIVPVDEESCERLLDIDPIFQREKAPHIEEHSLEIQLPFLQRALGSFKIVPILSTDNDIEICRRMAKAISDIIDDKTLVVASSDLSHYYKQKDAEALDNTLIEYIKKIDPEGFIKSLKIGKCEACGSSPIIIALSLAKMSGNAVSEIFKYATSGDVSGEYGRVVGYLARSEEHTSELQSH